MFNVMDAIVRGILRVGMFSGHDDEIAPYGERYELTGEFVSLKIITLTLDGTAVKNALFPPPAIINATFES